MSFSIASLCAGPALPAFALVANGLYSMVSYWVVQRPREFGIHLAMEARRGDVMERASRPTALTVFFGGMLRIAVSLAVKCVMIHLASSSSHDRLMRVEAFIGLMPVATIACVLPALRGASSIPRERGARAMVGRATCDQMKKCATSRLYLLHWSSNPATKEERGCCQLPSPCMSQPPRSTGEWYLHPPRWFVHREIRRR